MITQYFIPLGLTGIFYGFVVHRIYFRQQIGASTDAKRQEFDEKKKQTINMLIFVTVLFVLSYLPTHIWHYLMFYTSLIPQKKNTCYSSTFYMISYWVGISSCAYNVSYICITFCTASRLSCSYVAAKLAHLVNRAEWYRYFVYLILILISSFNLAIYLLLLQCWISTRSTSILENCINLW